MHEYTSKYRRPKPRVKRGAKKKGQTAGAASSLKRSIASTSSDSQHQQTPKRRRTSSERPPPPEQQDPGPGPSTSRTSSGDMSEKSDGPLELTASQRKISLFEELLPLSALRPSTGESSPGRFIIVSVENLKELVSKFRCLTCKKQNTLNLSASELKGFATKLRVVCSFCKELVSETNSSDRVKDERTTRPPFLVNRSMTEAFLAMGLGHGGMTTFCTTMGMNNLSKSSFDTHLKSLHEDILKFKETVLSESRRITRDMYEIEDSSLKLKEVIDAAETYDGSWQKRGFTSLYGLGFVIDIKSGLVIYYEILSKYCYTCLIAEKSLGSETEEYTTWYEQHQASGTCNRNYSGSSQAMEVEAASRIWRRSESYGFRFTTMLSDGDAKTHSHLQKEAPYGPLVTIEKEECLNHVAKRLFSGMKELVQTCRAKKITVVPR